MNIEFNKTYYSEALNKKKLNKEIVTDIKLSYGKVTYEKFSDKYNDYFLKNEFENHPVAKSLIACVAFSLWAAVAKTVYHIAVLVFSGIPKTLLNADSDYLLAHAFFIIQDLNEAFGYLASIFDLQFGLFHVQESEVQKTCYGHFLLFKQSKLDSSQNPSNYSKTSSTKFNTNLSISIKPSSSPKFTSDNSYHQSSIETNPLKSPLLPGITQKKPEDAIKASLIGCKYSEESSILQNLAEQYLMKNDPESAYKVIKNSSVDSAARGKFCEKLAAHYYQTNDLEQALKVIKDFYVDNTARGMFCEKLAAHYYQMNELEQALKVIKDSYVDNTARGMFCEKLAAQYYQMNELEQAFKVIKDSYVNNTARGKFCEKLAADYYQKNELEQAFKVIKDSYVDNTARGKFCEKLAENYLHSGDLDKACAMMKDTYVNDASKIRFFKQLADQYLQKNDWINLQKIAEACSIDQKNIYFGILIKQSFLGNYSVDVKKLIESIMHSTFISTLSFDEIMQSFNLEIHLKISQQINLVISSTYEDIKAQFINSHETMAMEFLYKLVREGIKKESILGAKSSPNHYSHSNYKSSERTSYKPSERPSFSVQQQKNEWQCPINLKNDKSEVGLIIQNILRCKNAQSSDFLSNIDELAKYQQGKAQIRLIICEAMQIDQKSTEIEIKQRYKKGIALKIHPDRCSGNDYALEAFKFINELYSKLF